LVPEALATVDVNGATPGASVVVDVVAGATPTRTLAGLVPEAGAMVEVKGAAPGATVVVEMLSGRAVGASDVIELLVV